MGRIAKQAALMTGAQMMETSREKRMPRQKKYPGMYKIAASATIAAANNTHWLIKRCLSLHSAFFPEEVYFSIAQAENNPRAGSRNP